VGDERLETREGIADVWPLVVLIVLALLFRISTEYFILYVAWPFIALGLIGLGLSATPVFFTFIERRRRRRSVNVELKVVSYRSVNVPKVPFLRAWHPQFRVVSETLQPVESGSFGYKEFYRKYEIGERIDGQYDPHTRTIFEGATYAFSKRGILFFMVGCAIIASSFYMYFSIHPALR
jgi:hypothetical protein